jgi:hypothetical protein
MYLIGFPLTMYYVISLTIAKLAAFNEVGQEDRRLGAVFDME